MGPSLGLVMMLAWAAISAGLFRVLGPRRGTLVAIVGGNLVVPCLVFDIVPVSRLQLTQPAALGLAVVLGMLAADFRSLSRIRLDRLDLPMLAYVAYPLTGLLTNGGVAAWDTADMLLQRGLGVLVPYAAARLYLGDAEGARHVAIAIVLATLLYVPVVVYEAAVGPTGYLGTRLFGANPLDFRADRLGGWRPAGLFLNGLTLAVWMALAAVVASGLWLGRSWRPRPSQGPSWGPALVLALAAAGCRSLYGDITLGLGLAAALATRILRTRGVIALLLLAAPVYLGLRIGGLWDAQLLTRLAGVAGRSSTVEFRLAAEDTIVRRVLARHPILGFGVEIWHSQAVSETIEYWPDGQWLIALWSGGLAGLVLHLVALFLIPAGLALARTPATKEGQRPDPAWPCWVLALFSALCLLDGLHNNSVFTPRALAAGSLAGIAAGRRRGSTPGPRAGARPSGRVTVSAPPPSPDIAVLPVVTATACLLYVFGHAPVADHEAIKLVGGLGAGLLFAAAGGVGAWAAGVVPLTRLGAFAGLFAALGVSFNLALHPTTTAAAAATADILQGLALCGLAVACWRRWAGVSALGDAVLAALPLLAYFWLEPVLPAFPGSQYLIATAGPGSDRSLFSLLPWLTLAALGAWATGQGAAVNGAAAVLHAATAAAAAWLDRETGRPVKFPMNLTYALLSATAIAAVFALAQGVKRHRAAAQAIGWLGRRWLVYFYVHFAVVYVLAHLPAGRGMPAAALWGLMAAASLGGTYLVVRTAAPFSGLFRNPWAWAVPPAVIVAAGTWPGLPPLAVSGMAGCAGLVFAAYHETLAYLIVNANIRPLQHSQEPARDRPGGEAPAAPVSTGGPGRGLARLAAALALLALPELIGWVLGTGTR
jgi:hypothetical protein